MRHFVYCKDADGGFDAHLYSFEEGAEIDLILYGWMSDSCKEQDTALVEWMKSCDIGEFFYHRMGMCFRVKEIK